MYKNVFKRVLDFIFSLIGILTLSLLFITISIGLAFYNRGTPFFFQKRPGKDEKVFKVIKFKTMTDKKNNKGQLLPDSERLTKLGAFIRKTSLDEIPQLINVLKGDMSIIGPRPLLPEYLPLYNDYQKKRHDLKPGITGWAQVNGRNAISWQEKFNFDVWYVENVSFILDLKIFFLTVIKVFKSEGINNAGEATTTPFKGNE
ncbi:sugar transferase [Winogradskyella haliclonae]|uniref:Sugar transferase n=1 Tax=Winogradskyella haliclonae TaxID=2048558 RepID=A0ABQ2BV43_9FLAO|nr:sugar transferase [Winogradskyella haliclonae]GGI56294.1 sugar transferase [Winogradskyella haliclonae]